LFVCGFRRFAARPIFSSNARGVDKQKLERFLQPGVDAVASFYTGIIYAPCPVLMLSRSRSLIGDDNVSLVKRKLVFNLCCCTQQRDNQALVNRLRLDQ
jgi:hypothetical protein